MNKPIVNARVSKRRNANGEYQVRAYDQDGKRIPDADHFTPDLDDAKATAERMVVAKIDQATPNHRSITACGRSIDIVSIVLALAAITLSGCASHGEVRGYAERTDNESIAGVAVSASW